MISDRKLAQRRENIKGILRIGTFILKQFVQKFENFVTEAEIIEKDQYRFKFRLLYRDFLVQVVMEPQSMSKEIGFILIHTFKFPINSTENPEIVEVFKYQFDSDGNMNLDGSTPFPHTSFFNNFEKQFIDKWEELNFPIYPKDFDHHS